MCCLKIEIFFAHHQYYSTQTDPTLLHRINPHHINLTTALSSWSPTPLKSEQFYSLNAMSILLMSFFSNREGVTFKRATGWHLANAIEAEKYFFHVSLNMSFYQYPFRLPMCIPPCIHALCISSPASASWAAAHL